VDASYSHDTTAVAYAWQMDDQRTGVGVHVWAARGDAPAHEYQSGGVIRMEPVKDWIIDFCARYEVREIAFDPAYFRETAESLQDMGLPMLRMDQQTTMMRDAEQVFHDSVVEEMIAHDGDEVLRRHVASVVSSRRPR
jgi:phage terminase large subunit-like protein